MSYVHSRVEKSSDETVGEHAMSNKSFVITTFLVRYNYLSLFPYFVFVISTFLVRYSYLSLFPNFVFVITTFLVRVVQASTRKWRVGLFCNFYPSRTRHIQCWLRTLTPSMEIKGGDRKN